MGKYSNLSVHSNSKVFNVFDPFYNARNNSNTTKGSILSEVSLSIQQVLQGDKLDAEGFSISTDFDLFVSKMGGNVPVLSSDGMFYIADEVQVSEILPRSSLEMICDGIRVMVLFDINQLASEYGRRNVDVALLYAEVMLGFDLEKTVINSFQDQASFSDLDVLTRIGVLRNSGDYVSQNTDGGLIVDLSKYYIDALSIKEYGQKNSWADLAKLNLYTNKLIS